MGGMGDVTPLVTGIDTALNDATAAYISTQVPTCPPGYIFNSAAGGCQFANTITATASVNPGMLVLIGIGLYLFMKGR